MSEQDERTRANALYATKLDETIESLQKQLQEQEAVLEKLRSTQEPIAAAPSLDQRTRLYQLRLLTSTYRTLTAQAPSLPPRKSPIPALLAHRLTAETIAATHVQLATCETTSSELRARVEKERADVKDAEAINAALLRRIDALRESIATRSQQTSAQLARKLLREAEQKRKHFDAEATRLTNALEEFVSSRLAPMLAAEELGGPIAGDVPDIDDAALGAGFNAKGKIRRNRSGKDNQSAAVDDQRQRRIDEIWGPRSRAPHHDGDMDDSMDLDDDQDAPWDEKTAAAAEMKDLLHRLQEALFGALEGREDVYIELRRESAAARFLVRSKIAVFHPRNAKKLRLVDFGGEVGT